MTFCPFLKIQPTLKMQTRNHILWSALPCLDTGSNFESHYFKKDYCNHNCDKDVACSSFVVHWCNEHTNFCATVNDKISRGLILGQATIVYKPGVGKLFPQRARFGKTWSRGPHADWKTRWRPFFFEITVHHGQHGYTYKCDLQNKTFSPRFSRFLFQLCTVEDYFF